MHILNLRDVCGNWLRRKDPFETPSDKGKQCNELVREGELHLF